LRTESNLQISGFQTAETKVTCKDELKYALTNMEQVGSVVS